MTTDRHSLHVRFPQEMWERLVKATADEHLPFINTAVVQAVGEWLDRRDAEKKGEE